MSYSNLVKLAFEGFRQCQYPFKIEYVHLKGADGGAAGYAWASSVRVLHDREYPACHEPFLGQDFLLLWPYAMAFHVWLSYKERERYDMHMDVASRMIVNRPPSLLQKKNLADVAHDGAVALRDLTVAQRFFVASLRPNLPHFALRQPNDKWIACLRKGQTSAEPQRYGAALVDHSRAQGDDEVSDVDAGPQWAPGDATMRASLDLPDELVERILSLRIALDLPRIESAVATVALLKSVSRQFCACTRDVTARMFARVHSLCLELHGTKPPLPSCIQDVLWASGLTLRSAFATNLCDWPSYVRERRKHSLREHERSCDPSERAKRHALLWW